MKYILLYSCLLVVGQVLVTHGAVVTLPGLGDIEGSTTQSYLLNRTIYQFQGIPYAKPPVGDLRFKRPQKWDEPWTEKLNCTSFRAVCPQYYFSDYPEEIQSEDCLHVNVYTNQLKGGGNGTGRAVMFFIHGGSFYMGSARLYTPEYLLDEDVVLVVLQYRLGPLGFLSLKTAAIPGNMGMVDMILALEWVRDNIHVFGGDANRVTLFGNSAGAAAVSLMLFSPLVKDGLLQRVIVQSGSPLGDWSIDNNPVPHARWIAKRVGCNKTHATSYLARCLRRKPYRLILEAHMAFKSGPSGVYPRMVSAGNHIVWKEAGSKSFLTKDPAVLLEEGKVRRVSMMAGTTKHEGSVFLGAVHALSRLRPDQTSSKTESVEYDVVREVLRLCGVKDRTGYLQTLLQHQFFTESEIGNFTAMVPGLVDILGTALIKSSVVALATANSRHENTYLYSFNFYGSHSGERVFRGLPLAWPAGITHEDELLYLFPQEKVLNAPERAMSKRMVQLWTNFARNGVPEADDTPDWLPMSTPEGPYLRIDKFPKVLQSFVKEEYMIAVKEGMTDPYLTQPNFENRINN